MCSEFHVKREWPSHLSSIIWRNLTMRLENSFLNRILLRVTSCCTDISVSPLLSFPLHSCLCYFIQWKSLLRFAGVCWLHNCARIGVVDRVWNVMAQAQKPDFVFRRNGRVSSVHPTTGSRGVRISGSNAGYTMFRGSVKGTGYPLHLSRREVGVSSVDCWQLRCAHQR